MLKVMFVKLPSCCGDDRIIDAVIDLDAVERARALQGEGMGLRGVAGKLGCSVNTLRGALSA
ncbi:MAG: hypothetical protein WCA47_11425 [Terriglobales bacterium]|jgi:hypothetical protein